MKIFVRIIVAVFVMIMLFSTFGVLVGASCFNYESDFFEQDEISVEDGMRIIKYYNGSFMHGFAKGETIETLTSNMYVLGEMISIYDESKNSVVSRYMLKDRMPAILSDGTGFDGVLFFAEYTTEKTIDKLQQKLNAKIENIICLSGIRSGDGVYICYLTDKGTYVLYKEHETSEPLYLFPLDDFNIYAKKYQEEKLKKIYNENGEVIIGSSFGFSDIIGTENYLVDFERGPILYGIIVFAFICVLVAFSVTAVIFLHRKTTL